MAGPSPQFLAALNAGLVPPPQAPVDMGEIEQPAPMDMGDVDAPMTREPTSFTRGDTPREMTSFTRGQEPLPGPEATQVQSQAHTPQAMPDDVQFAPVVSRGSPAREVPLRGPKANELLEESYGYPAAAAQVQSDRTQRQAEREQAMYDDQAEHALNQQAAMERMAARRGQELQLLRDNYLNTVNQLGTMQVDNNRLWNNASTGDKIGTTLLILLGAAAHNGPGPSLVQQVIEKKISDDVDSQKRAYEMGLNIAKGQQTAYSMAMDQYGSEDAAYHAAMASGQQAVAAKINGMNAQWKGTNAQNQATALQGDLLSKSRQNAAQGLGYLQPTAGSVGYAMSIRGQRIPGLVPESKAQGYAVEHGVKPAERVDEELVKGGVQSTLQQQKLQAEAGPEGVGKAGAEKLAVEGVQAARERDANLKAIDNAISDLPKIVKGGMIDSAYSELPAWFPYGENARANTNVREAYNIRAKLAVGAAYKLSTDSAEPKRRELLEEYSKPFVITTGDTEKSARTKMLALQKLVAEGAPAKGAPPRAPQRLPSSFTPVGGR